MRDSTADITSLLRSVSSGGRGDLDALMAAIYADLRRLAVEHMRAERGSHTLQPTAVVHEAYLKLVDQRSTKWADRVHFFAVASRLIRRILVDHARGKHAAKRGGGRAAAAVELADLAAPSGAMLGGVDLIDLDDALSELAAIDEQQARVVEMRFFGGLTIEEIAAQMGVGKRTVDRDWSAAKAWLLFRLGDGAAGGAETEADGLTDGANGA